MTTTALPSTLHTGFGRGRVEMLQFVRDRTALIFTFAFPALLLVLFGTSATSWGSAPARSSPPA
jgi:ABC-2 type transport system permease protein